MVYVRFFFYSLFSKSLEDFKVLVLKIQSGLFIIFSFFIIFTSNPFLVNSVVVAEGLGLNPILQDPALAIHPPMLYLGYVGFSLVFSLAIANLLKKNSNFISDSQIKEFKKIKSISKNKSLNLFSIGIKNSNIEINSIINKSNYQQLSLKFNKKNYTFDKRLINLVAKVHQINFIDFEESLSKINEVLNNTQEIPNYKFEDFKDYYSDYFLKI